MPSELDEFKDILRTKYDLHCKCFDDRDAAPLFEHFFAKDALWAAQDFPELRGEAEMRPFFDEVTSNYTVAVRPLDTYVNGDNGWDFVDYPVTPRNPDEEAWSFRVLFNWARIDGDWKANAIVSYQVKS